MKQYTWQWSLLQIQIHAQQAHVELNTTNSNSRKNYSTSTYTRYNYIVQKIRYNPQGLWSINGWIFINMENSPCSILHNKLEDYIIYILSMVGYIEQKQPRWLEFKKKKEMTWIESQINFRLVYYSVWFSVIVNNLSKRKYHI